MICPKCGADAAAESSECPRCGVILRKARATESGSYPIPSPPKNPSVLPVIAVAIVAVFLVVVFAARNGTPRPGAAPTEAVGGWYSDAGGYAGALETQKASNAPILLYFHTTWCGWCKRLDADVFNSAAFAEKYRDVLKVRVDPESTEANRRLNSEFDVSGYPAVIVIKPDGSRETLPGYSPPDAYFARLDQALGKS